MNLKNEKLSTVLNRCSFYKNKTVHVTLNIPKTQRTDIKQVFKRNLKIYLINLQFNVIVYSVLKYLRGMRKNEFI